MARPRRRLLKMSDFAGHGPGERESPMRRHRHSRPKHRVIATFESNAPDLNEIASRCRYVGSAEHKGYPSPAGHPALRSDASACDPRYNDFEPITEALRTGIRRGCIAAIFEGGFPKYVWGWLDGQLYEARHINGPQGTYKAYPLEEVDYPKDEDKRLNWEEHGA
jgi:hypothetical protein